MQLETQRSGRSPDNWTPRADISSAVSLKIPSEPLSVRTHPLPLAQKGGRRQLLRCTRGRLALATQSGSCQSALSVKNNYRSWAQIKTKGEQPGIRRTWGTAKADRTQGLRSQREGSRGEMSGEFCSGDSQATHAPS